MKIEIFGSSNSYVEKSRVFVHKGRAKGSVLKRKMRSSVDRLSCWLMTLLRFVKVCKNTMRRNLNRMPQGCSRFNLTRAALGFLQTSKHILLHNL